jgi:hypothetical protein
MGVKGAKKPQKGRHETMSQQKGVNNSAVRAWGHGRGLNRESFPAFLS